jgi:hypothetical protein
MPDNLSSQVEDEALPIPLQEVKSSVIRKLGWENGILNVVMVSGKNYFYVAPKQILVDGLTWASIGVWYNTVVKGKFPTL